MTDETPLVVNGALLGLQITPTYGLHQLGGGIYQQGLAAPGAPSISNQGAAGATTYTYYVVAVDRAGRRTVVSPAGTTTTGNATLNGTNFNRLTWTAVTGAVSYDILKTNTATKLANTTALTLNDTGQATSAYTAPTHNESGDVSVDGWLGPMSAAGDLLYAGASALARLGIGSAGQGLVVNAGATAPVWGIPTLHFCHVHNNGNPTIATATPTVINFNIDDYNADNWHDSVTNNSRITPTFAGKYLVHGRISYQSNATNARWAIIKKNGLTVAEQAYPAIGTTSGFASVNQILDANGTTDYFELYALQDSGVGLQLNTGNPDTVFEAIYLGP